MPHARKVAARVSGLIAAPLAFLIAWTALAATALTLADALPPISDRAVSVGLAALVVPVAAAAAWWGRRIGNRSDLSRLDVVVPACLALGAVALASAPEAGVVLGEFWPASAAAIAVWCAGLIGVGMALRALAAREQFLIVYAAALLGGFALLNLACAVYVLIALPATAAPRLNVLLWYPAAISGVDPGLVMDAPYQLADSVKQLPVVLTVATVLTLTAVITVARQRKATTANQS